MPSRLIVGAGKLGQRFYTFLESKDLSPISLSKSAKPWSKRHIQADLLAKDFALPELPIIDTVFIILAPASRSEESYQATYIDAVTALIKQLAKQQSNFHCVFLSATSVYGSKQCGLIDESILPQPDNFRGQLLLQAEDNLKALHSSASIVRASGLYSSKRKRLLQSLLNPDAIDNPKWLNLIHEADLCQWLYQAALQQWPLSIASDGNPFTRQQLQLPSAASTSTIHKQLKSRYLDKVTLKHRSFADWLKCQ